MYDADIDSVVDSGFQSTRAPRYAQLHRDIAHNDMASRTRICSLALAQLAAVSAKSHGESVYAQAFIKRPSLLPLKHINLAPTSPPECKPGTWEDSLDTAENNFHISDV